MTEAQEFRVLITSESDPAKVGVEIARALGHPFGSDHVVVLRVEKTRVVFDPVVYDGEEPPGYVSPTAVAICGALDPEHGWVCVFEPDDGHVLHSWADPL